MLLRTISVETAEQTELNAALLCGFAIPASDRNFIAYSLNEQVDENDSRVYIASLFKTDDGFRLGRLDTDEACEAAIQVFRQLVREATTGNRRTSDLAYHLIDLQDAAIAPSRREEHRSLVLEREWVMKLVTFESPHGYGPALDGEEPCAEVPPLVQEALFEDAAPDVLAEDDADETTDGPAEPIDEPEAAEDETVTEAGCVEPEPRPEAETAAPEGGAPAEFAAKAEQSAKVADAEAIGAFVDNASHLREELADLAQMLHPALHAADATVRESEKYQGGGRDKVGCTGTDRTIAGWGGENVLPLGKEKPGSFGRVKKAQLIGSALSPVLSNNAVDPVLGDAELPDQFVSIRAIVPLQYMQFQALARQLILDRENKRDAGPAPMQLEHQFL